MIGVYFESWACPWAATGAASALAKIEKPIDVVYLSFVNPNCTYLRNQQSFANTGLNFSLDFPTVKIAINLLRAKGIRVMLAVGGASYVFTTYNVANCVALMEDLGCDGLDLDWEPADGYAAAQQLGPLIARTRTALGSSKFLSFAGFSTGCYDPNGDTFRGMGIPGLQSNGHQLDWVNIMAYDAGKDFDVIQCYESYKKYFKKPVCVGFEVGKQGWGDAWLTLDDVTRVCKYISPRQDGCFVWAYFKSDGPSAVSVCQTASGILNAPVSSLTCCPRCKTSLTLTIT